MPKMPFDATGTIGSMECEKSLNKILADRIAINGDICVGKLLKCFYAYRRHLKNMEGIVDNPTHNYLRNLLKQEAIEKVKEIVGDTFGFDKDVLTHALCCLHAYFAKANRYQRKAA